MGGFLDRPCPIERRTERVQTPVRQHSDCNDFGIGHNRLARVSPTNYPPRRPAAKGKSKQAAHANRSGAVGGARASDALTRGVRSVYIASSSLTICRTTVLLNTWKPPIVALLPPTPHEAVKPSFRYGRKADTRAIWAAVRTRKAAEVLHTKRPGFWPGRQGYFV